MRLCLVILACVFCQAARSATYYISYASGNDSTGNGTLGNPWLTYSKAISNGLAPGDTVTNISSGYNGERPVPTVSGTAVSPIIFAGGWGPTPTNISFLKGVSYLQPIVTNNGFQIGSPGAPINYIVVKGIVANNTNTYSSYNKPGCSGIYVAGNGCLVLSNFCYDCFVGLNQESRTNLSTGNINGNNTWAWNVSITNALAAGSFSGTNSLIFGNLGGWSVQTNLHCVGGNSSFLNSLDADGFYPDGWGLSFISNQVWGCNINDPKNNNGAHVDGFQIFPAGNGQMGVTSNCLYSANYVNSTNGNGAAFFSETSVGTTFINNECVSHKGISQDTGCISTTILNNTLMGITNDPIASPIGIALASQNGFDIENNILFNWSAVQIAFTTPTGSQTATHNMEYRDDGMALQTDASYSAFIGNDFWGTNPAMVGPYSAPIANFQLKSISFAINHGTSQPSVTKDFVGQARPVNFFWDVGSYEFPGIGGGSPIVITGTVSVSGNVTMR